MRVFIFVLVVALSMLGCERDASWRAAGSISPDGRVGDVLVVGAQAYVSWTTDSRRQGGRRNARLDLVSKAGQQRTLRTRVNAVGLGVAAEGRNLAWLARAFDADDSGALELVVSRDNGAKWNKVSLPLMDGTRSLLAMYRGEVYLVGDGAYAVLNEDGTWRQLSAPVDGVSKLVSTPAGPVAVMPRAHTVLSLSGNAVPIELPGVQEFSSRAFASVTTKDKFRVGDPGSRALVSDELDGLPLAVDRSDGGWTVVAGSGSVLGVSDWLYESADGRTWTRKRLKLKDALHGLDLHDGAGVAIGRDGALLWK